MKRKIFMALAVGTFAFAFASCKKTEAPTPADPGSANISGVIRADIDQRADSNMVGGYVFLGVPEYPPAGTQITFQTSAGNLDPTPSGGPYETLSWATTINADGTFSIDVPAINAPYTIDVYFDEFAADYYVFGTPNGDPPTIADHKYDIAPTTIGNIYDGGNYILNMDYLP